MYGMPLYVIFSYLRCMYDRQCIVLVLAGSKGIMSCLCRTREFLVQYM